MLEVRCVRCGKLFIQAPQHIYKDHKGIYCSWTCFNHRKDVDATKKYRPCSYEVEQYSIDGDFIRVFPDAKSAAEHFNGTPNGIRVACRNETNYKGFVWRYRK